MHTSLWTIVFHIQHKLQHIQHMLHHIQHMLRHIQHMLHHIQHLLCYIQPMLSHIQPMLRHIQPMLRHIQHMLRHIQLPPHVGASDSHIVLFTLFIYMHAALQMVLLHTKWSSEHTQTHSKNAKRTSTLNLCGQLPGKVPDTD